MSTVSNKDGESRVYSFGDIGRIRPYVLDVESLTVLNIRNLLRLRPEDVIISARPRSTLLEFLFLLLKPNKRPKIVMVADGLIFRENCRKKVNRRYGWLYRYVIGDVLLVNQSLGPLGGLIDDLSAVKSMMSYGVEQKKSMYDAPTFLLVSGNDPFFDFNELECINAFVDAFKEIRRHFGEKSKIILSSGNRVLSNAVLRRCDGVEEVGRIVDADIDLENCIFVGSPSSVMHEQFIKGRPTYIISYYSKCGLNYFCPSINALLASPIRDGLFDVEFNVPVGLFVQEKFKVSEFGQLISKRLNMGLKRSSFFREFQFLVLLNELRILISGRL